MFFGHQPIRLLAVQVAIVAAQVLQISQLDHPIRAALQPAWKTHWLSKGLKKDIRKILAISEANFLWEAIKKKPEMQIALHHPLLGPIKLWILQRFLFSERFEISETLWNPDLQSTFH